MARVLSFPFRLAPFGTAVTVEVGSDDYHAELIASHLLTHRGERDMVPNYGVVDPTFGQPDDADLAASMAAFGPDVRVDSFDIEYPNDRTALITVAFG